MSDEHLLRVRRAVMRLGEKAEGEMVGVRLNGGPAGQMAEHAVSFGRKKAVGIRVTSGVETLTLTRDSTVLESRFSVLDKLEVGAKHHFDVQLPEVRAIRVGASARGQATGRRYSCTLDPERGGVTVTRLSADEPARRGRARSSDLGRWGLDRLDRLYWVDLEATATQLSSARQAIAMAQYKHGWMLTSKIVGGKLRVWRLDHPAEGPVQPASASAQAMASGLLAGPGASESSDQADQEGGQMSQI